MNEKRKLKLAKDIVEEIDYDIYKELVQEHGFRFDSIVELITEALKESDNE